MWECRLTLFRAYALVSFQIPDLKISPRICVSCPCPRPAVSECGLAQADDKTQRRGVASRAFRLIAM
jgi:hypothetical protein